MPPFLPYRPHSGHGQLSQVSPLSYTSPAHLQRLPVKSRQNPKFPTGIFRAFHILFPNKSITASLLSTPHFLHPGLVPTICRAFALAVSSARTPTPGSSFAFESQSKCTSSGLLRALHDLRRPLALGLFFSHSPAWPLPTSDATLFRYLLICSLSSP